MNEHLAEMTRSALSQVEPMAEKGWAPAVSIARQLRWCLARSRGENAEPMPGPLSMGLIATREIDMYGNQPELAELICDIEREANRVLV